MFAGNSNVIIGQQQCTMFLIAIPTHYTWFRHFHIQPSDQLYPAGLSSADIRPLHSLLQLQIRWWSQQLVFVPILSQIYPLHTFKFDTGILHLIQINHQPDATVFQFIILTFVYSSTSFGRFFAHHQELNDCSGSPWF